MLKRIVLAVLPLTLFTLSANAGDDLNIDIDNITNASAEIMEMDLDIDLDALAADAGEEAEREDAIEACFRRVGYLSLIHI